MSNKAFRWRAFVSFFLLFSFLLSALSGVILFLRPEGSLADWTGWSALGLDKKGWEGLHAVSIFFFLLSAAIHLVYNWRPLLAYCRSGKAGKTPAWQEIGAALLLVGLMLAGTLGKWFPLSRIHDLRAWFKSGSAVVDIAPPVVEAENRTLAELCPLLGIDEKKLLGLASKQGIRVKHLGQTLAEIAQKNNSSPEKIFMLLKSN